MSISLHGELSLPFGCIMYIRMYCVIMKLQNVKFAYEMVREILGGKSGISGDENEFFLRKMMSDNHCLKKFLS